MCNINEVVFCKKVIACNFETNAFCRPIIPTIDLHKEKVTTVLSVKHLGVQKVSSEHIEITLLTRNFIYSGHVIQSITLHKIITLLL